MCMVMLKEAIDFRMQAARANKGLFSLFKATSAADYSHLKIWAMLKKAAVRDTLAIASALPEGMPCIRKRTHGSREATSVHTHGSAVCKKPTCMT